MGRLAAGQRPAVPSRAFSHGKPKVSLVNQATEQTHLAMGFYAFGRSDERRFALKLLSVILGENMSSRLFQRLREQYGFCYSVQTGMVALSDAGLINIYAGLDTAKLEKAVRDDFSGDREHLQEGARPAGIEERRRITPSARRCWGSKALPTR